MFRPPLYIEKRLVLAAEPFHLPESRIQLSLICPLAPSNT